MIVEVVVVRIATMRVVGFVCVQLKKSFCYNEYMPEIMEVYVVPTYIKKEFKEINNFSFIPFVLPNPADIRNPLGQDGQTFFLYKTQDSYT